ncbi:uncharacterized protein LOC122257038 isoform X2 [Penaeus japonicus]|uniref:uncharacterized protein LOC122257038 isoform X2 n=1 Tax=Penaeus japonicus TaxID=27405 RepID=UPI001C710B74|nr:uncharacterized protein LOC122257038 isoform X2 [Penaeus japonicus]
MRKSIWLTAMLLALAMEAAWGNPLGAGSSSRNPAKPRASAQIYPLADREGNSLYALPPKLTGDMIHSLARTRHWRPYQAIGTSYDVARKPGRRDATSPVCPQGKVFRRGVCQCPYLSEWDEAEGSCVCTYGTYRDSRGNCHPYL